MGIFQGFDSKGEDQNISTGIFNERANWLFLVQYLPERVSPGSLNWDTLSLLWSALGISTSACYRPCLPAAAKVGLVHKAPGWDSGGLGLGLGVFCVVKRVVGSSAPCFPIQNMSTAFPVLVLAVLSRTRSPGPVAKDKKLHGGQGETHALNALTAMLIKTSQHLGTLSLGPVAG